jgi:hypothetical protein
MRGTCVEPGPTDSGRSTQSVQVATRHSCLDLATYRPTEARPPERGTRERSDRDPYSAVVASGDQEKLLAGLGVARERAVGEAAAAGLLDDVDDPARDGQPDPADAEAEHHVRTRRYLCCGGRHRQPGSAMQLPTHQGGRCRREEGLSVPEDTAALDVVVSRRQSARGRANVAVVEGSACRPGHRCRLGACGNRPVGTRARRSRRRAAARLWLRAGRAVTEVRSPWVVGGTPSRRG